MFSVQKMNVLCYCCIIWTGWWRRLWHRELKVKYKWVIPVLRRNERGRDCLVRVEMFPLHWNILPVLSSILTCLRHYPIFNTESFSALAARVSLTCDETQQPFQSNSLPGFCGLSYRPAAIYQTHRVTSCHSSHSLWLLLTSRTLDLQTAALWE